MIRRPPRSTRTDTLFPYTTLFRSQVRVSDVARVELGADDYASNTYLSGKPTVVMGVFQRPGSNALAAAEAVQAEMDRSDEHTSELQSLMCISYAVFRLTKKIKILLHTTLYATYLTSRTHDILVI